MKIYLRHRLVALIVAFLAAVGMAAELDAGVWYGSSVGDERWVVEQDNHYYPYGMLMGESSNILLSASKQPLTLTGGLNPYRFGSKEYLTTNDANLLDFTARTYDPATLLFLTPDPKATDYTPLNSYLYCGSDPINRVDKDGEKIYYINMEGRPITPDKGLIIGGVSQADYEKQTEGLDQIIVVGNNNTLCGATELVPEETIEGTITIKLTKNKGFGFVVRGDENGKHIFKTLSKIITGKNDIEFSHIMVGEKDELGLNYVTTSHTPNKEASAYKLIETQLMFGYTLREMDHSHSENTIISDGDMRVKEMVTKLLPSQTDLKFNIYHVPTDKYKPY